MMNQEMLDSQRGQFQRVYDAIVRCQKQFFAWFDEAKAIKPKSKDIWELVNEFRRDESLYRRWITDLPKVGDFTPEEMENRTGEVARLCELGDQIIELGTTLQAKLGKLRYLANGNRVQ